MPETGGTTVNIRLLIQAVDKASKTVAQLQGQLNEVANGAVKLATDSKTAGQQGAAAMEKFSQGASKAEGTFNKMLSAMTGFGTLGLKLTALAGSLSAPFILATTSAAGFERSMSHVSAVTAGAEENFEALKDKAAELGRTTEFTAKQAAEGMVFLGQAGLDAKEVIEGITPSLTLAVAAGIELAQAADIATNVVSAMRLPVDELSGAVDILANTCANANTNIVQLADAMVYAGPLASASKIPLEEVAGIIGVLGNNGIQASMAGTALRGMLRSLTSPTKEAQKVLDELGISINVSSDGTLDLVDALHQLGDAQLTAAQANKLFGRFAAAGALAVTANTKELDKMIASNYAAQGAAEKMAETMKSNLKGAFIELSSAIDGFRRSIGDPLLEPLTSIVHTLTSVVNKVNDLIAYFPVLTGVVVKFSAAVIALTAAAGFLSLAIAGVASALGILNAQLGTTLTIGGLLAGGWGKLKGVATLLIGSLTSLRGILSLLMKVVGPLVTLFNAAAWAIRGLFVALATAHPIIQFVALVGTIAYALAEWHARTERLIRENAKLAASMNVLNTSLNKSMSRLEELEEGSEEYIATTKAMREEILRVAEKHEELEESAKEAADSIDEMTGRIIDGGEALKKFQREARDLQLEALRNQLELMTKEWEKLNGQAGIFNATMHSLGMSIKLVWALITDGMEGVNRVYREQQQASEKALNKVKSVGEGVIETLDKFGEIDMDSSREEMLLFLTDVKGYTEGTAKVVVEKFEEMKKSSDRMARSQSNLDAMTLDQLREELDDTTESVKELNEEYDKASRKSEEAAAAWKKSGSKAAKAAAKSAYDQRVAVNNERKKGEADFDKLLAITTEKELAELEKRHEYELDEIERKKDIKDKDFDTEWEYNRAVTNLNKDYALQKTAILSDLLVKATNSNAKELKSYTDLTGKLKQANDEVTEAYQDSDDARIKHANEVAEAIIDANRKAADIQISLLDDPIDQLEKEQAREIAILEETMQEKGIKREQYEKLITAINAKYEKKRTQATVDANAARLEAQANYLDEKEKYYKDSLDREFQYGEISAEEYVNKTIGLQIAAIDREIAILKAKLAEFKGDVENNPIVIKIKGEIEELEAAKGGIKTVGREGLLDEKQAEELLRANQINQDNLQARMDSMRIYKDGIDAMNEAELESLRYKYEQDIIMFSTYTKDKEEINQRWLDHLKALKQAEEDLDRQTEVTKLGWYSEMAGSAEAIFADLYEATGKKRKEFLMGEKAAAIAMTIMNGQAAAIKAMADPGGIAGKVMAALILLQAAASVARISATPINAAEGGEIKGTSPHDKADNIPAMLTAKEWVMPVKSVKKYGKRVMQGIQRGLFPEEVFKGYRLPVPVPTYSRGYAAGGEVMSKKDSVGVKTNQPVVTPPPQPITIMNITDPSELDRYLNTSAGQDAVINILSSRAETVRRVLR